MESREYHLDGCLISTDKSRLDVPAVHDCLSRESHWAAGRTPETVRRSIEGSLCLGLYDPRGGLAGFARVISDFVEMWMERKMNPT